MTTHNRRDMIGLTAAALAASATPAAAQSAAPRYGLIGQMIAKPGQRDALLACLRDGTTGMPGCLSYNHRA